MGKTQIALAFLSGVGLLVAPSDYQVIAISVAVWVIIIILAVLLSIRHDRREAEAWEQAKRWEYEGQYDGLQEEMIERLSKEAEARYDVDPED